MPYRTVNLLSDTQANFGASPTATDFGGWTVGSGSASTHFLYKVGAYNKYVPNKPGVDYSGTYFGSSIGFKTTSSNNITIFSPYVNVEAGKRYLVHIFSALSVAGKIKLDVEFYSDTSSTTPIANSNYASGLSARAVAAEAPYEPNWNFTAPVGSTAARIKVTAEGSSGALASDSILLLFDPIFSDDAHTSWGPTTSQVYNDLPAFMQLDDQNINDVQSNNQRDAPLQRFVETLCYKMDQVTDTIQGFDYTRATEGTESKSKLTDPLTADANYLLWLACVTGSTLLASGSGFTPWAALESYDGGDAGTTPGEWSDYESLSTWLGLQDHDPEFFDTVDSFRNQIDTGFTGIHAGRPDTIVNFVRTMLDTSTPADHTVVVMSDDMDNDFRSEILVDSTVDPDPTGNLIINAVNNGLPAGAQAVKTANVMESGDGSYDMSTIMGGTHSNANAEGVDKIAQSFISDRDGYARHVLMNSSTSANYPEIGGGIGNAHFSSGSAYYYGEVDASVEGRLETATSALADLGGSTTGWDIILQVTDLTAPTAAVGTAGSGTPLSWLFREKRHLISGQHNGGATNDWALYIVSGLTFEPDTQSRLLFVEGYNTANATNYAYSDPIDLASFDKDICFRVSKPAGSGEKTISFFAQSSLYEDWSSNAIGSGSITGVTSSAGASAYIQVLGELTASGTWSDASPASCAVKRAMVFNAPISFTGSSSTSSSAHAVLDGSEVSDFGAFTYQPTVDIDVSSASVYDGSFDAATWNGSTAGTLSVTVQKSAASDIDFKMITGKTKSGTALWYFGESQDTLAVSGSNFSGSTSYDVKTTVVDVSDGSTSEKIFTPAASSGVVTITTSTDADGGAGTTLFGGQTLTKIEVYDSTDGSASGSRVAYFLPTTIGASATAGTDADSQTWTLTRTFPAVGTAYSPSQYVNKNMLHAYEGTPTMHNPPKLEDYSNFSVVMQSRRFWTGSEGAATYEVLNIKNASNQGLRIFYDGPKIKATYTDGSTTEAVEWTEAPAYGEWHLIVVRRDPTNGFQLFVNGTLRSTATFAVTGAFTTATTTATFSEGAADEYNPRFALAEFGFFKRSLTDIEIALLGTQIT